jgi:hypothetical protein
MQVLQCLRVHGASVSAVYISLLSVSVSVYLSVPRLTSTFRPFAARTRTFLAATEEARGFNMRR